MTKTEELELFATLGRGFPQLAQWLRAREAKHMEVLLTQKDHAQLLSAQGRVAAIREMLELLEKAPQSSRN